MQLKAKTRQNSRFGLTKSTTLTPFSLFPPNQKTLQRSVPCPPLEAAQTELCLLRAGPTPPTRSSGAGDLNAPTSERPMMETSHSSSIPSLLALLALLVLSSSYFLWKSPHLRHSSPIPNPNLTALTSKSLCDPDLRQHANSSDLPSGPREKLFFSSQTGTSRALADRLCAAGLPFNVVDRRLYEPEDLSEETLVLNGGFHHASTWKDGKPPPNAEFLTRWLADDFRVGSLLLSRCAVFGVGSRSCGKNFNATAKDFSRWTRVLRGTWMRFSNPGVRRLSGY